MNEVADAMEPLLLGNAIRYTRSSPRDTLAGVIRQSNEGEYDLHWRFTPMRPGPA